MDIDERKIGEWPNVALVPGTHIHAATGEHVEQPENTRIGRSRGADGPETAEPEQVPGEDGNEPEIGEIKWHREVVEGHYPSNCPYCGCERVVIGEYEPCHDEEWEYYIEHKDAKEAIGRKCFAMYAAYKTPEDAIRGADMRAERFAPSEAGSGPQDGSECDTREKLEADVCERTDCSWVTAPLWKVSDWLNRQAAITRRETLQSWQDAPNILDRENLRTIDRLTADAKRWADAANAQRLVAMEQADKVQELTAERDDLAHELRRARKAAKRWHELASGYRDKAAQFVEIIETLTATLDRKNARIKRLRGKLKRARNK